MKLVRAYAFLAGRHQVDGLKPQAQRDVTGLKYRYNRTAEGFAALIAFVDANPDALTLELADSLDTPAVRTYRAVRLDARFNVCTGSVLVVEVLCI